MQSKNSEQQHTATQEVTQPRKTKKAAHLKQTREGNLPTIGAKQRPVKAKHSNVARHNKGKAPAPGLVLHSTPKSRLIFEQLILGATNRQVKVTFGAKLQTGAYATFSKSGEADTISPENERFLGVMQTITGGSSTTHVLLVGQGEPGRSNAIIGAYRNVPEQTYDGEKVTMGSIDLMDMLKAQRYSKGKVPLRLLITHELYENYINQSKRKNKKNFRRDHKAALKINEEVEGVNNLFIGRYEKNDTDGTLTFSYTKGKEATEETIYYKNMDVVTKETYEKK